MKRCILVLSVVTMVMGLASCGSISQGISGKLTDAIFNDPVVNISVKIIAFESQKQEVYTPAVSNDGTFEQTLAPGNYRIELEDKSDKYIYSRKVEALKIESGKVVEKVYKLDPIVKQWIHGVVTDKETKKPVAGATIAFDNDKTITDKNGKYELRNYRSGMKKLEIKATGYMPLTKDYRMSDGETAEDFEITSVKFVQGASVNPMTDLISYVLEISKGTSPDTTQSIDVLTINNMPYSVRVETGEDEYVIYMTKFYKKSGQKYVSITKDEFDTKTKQAYASQLDMVNSIFIQFNTLKKSINTDVIKLESGNIVNYDFKAKYDGVEYACSLQLYFDGPNVGFANKLTMTASGKYYETTLKDLNQPKNRIADPSILK